MPPLEKFETLHPPNKLAPRNEHPPSFNGSFNPVPHAHQSHSHSQSPTSSSYPGPGPNQSTPSLHNSQFFEGPGLPPPSPSASRRSSFDSRLNGLHLNSPLNATPAASQISLASTLNRDRSIHNNSPGHDSIANSVTGSTYSGLSGPVPPMIASPPNPGRTAPPIIGTSRFPYPHPNAPSPTKGFPYAFPDPEIAGPASKDPPAADGRRTSTSSNFSHTSSLLHPIHALQTPMGMNSHAGSTPNLGPYGSRTDGEYLHHHHYLERRKQLSVDGANSTPYSRTPELRVTHKLAERKRRKEMKDLFDELRDALPAERGGKSSKWEVLTKGMLSIFFGFRFSVFGFPFLGSLLMSL